MATVAIIAILAGLTLGTLGYVNRKGAESRAKAEVAALAAAIESYKLDMGRFPRMDNPTSAALSGLGSTNLVQALSPTNKSPATNSAAWSNNPTGKVYFEPTPGILSTNGNAVGFVDPWGNGYNYRTNTNGNALRNIGFFDLWSTAGNAAATNEPNWIWH